MKILASDGLSEKAVQKLRSEGIEVLLQQVAQEQIASVINEHSIDTLIVRSRTKVTGELMATCPTLKVVVRAGVGMDNIDLESAKEKGITVLNTPTASSRSVAEMVFAHFFSIARNLHESNRLMPLEGDSNFGPLKKNLSAGVELTGKKLGVIGFGPIGMEVLKMGISLGMNVQVLTRKPVTKTLTLEFFDGQEVSFSLLSTNDMKAFLKDLDFLSINTPKTSEYIIDQKELDLLKQGAIIVNTARGGVINEKALIDAIEDKKVFGAGLDVFENEPKVELPILMNPSLSLSPHLGGSTIDAQEKIGLEVADQLITINNERLNK